MKMIQFLLCIKRRSLEYLLKRSAFPDGSINMATRSADDFDFIRTQLEKLKKEREEVEKATSEPDPNTKANVTTQGTPAPAPQEDYYGCGFIVEELKEWPIGYSQQKHLGYKDMVIDDGEVFHMNCDWDNAKFKLIGEGRIKTNGFKLLSCMLDIEESAFKHKPERIFI